MEFEDSEDFPIIEDSYDKKPFQVVVAIDFGTSRSGFAYAFYGKGDGEKTQSKEATIHSEWPGQFGVYPKTPTHLLYSPERKVEAWGYLARQRLAELRKDDKAKQYRFFSNFKMALHEGTTKTWNGDRIILHEGQRTILIDGEGVPVLELVVDYLQCLKDYTLEKLREQTSGELRDNEILWCLTIPAIWTDADKQVMRKAAQMAGLIGTDKNDAERLLLILEPEAAAVHCLDADTGISLSKLRPGTCFMVVDAGGGTVDITVYKVAGKDENKELALEELASGTGDACGSIYVDTQFQKYMRSILTDSVWQDFHDKEPLHFLSLMASWEQQKCGFDYRRGKDQTTYIMMGKLYTFLARTSPDTLERLGDDDQIELDYKTMIDFFQPALNGLIKQVEEQFTRLGSKPCDFIFLVGGFSKSSYLQERIKEKFGSKVKKIIVPKDAGAAILLGAVALGLDPSRVRARRTRMTYGIETRDYFDPSIDPVDKKIANPRGGFHCTDRFTIFVKAGDSVSIDQTVKRTFSAIYADQKTMGIACYTTRRKKVRYTDESGVYQIGNLTISREDTTSGYDWSVEVTMYFGKSEIKVEAKDAKTGKMEKTELHFSHTYFRDFIIDDKPR